MLLLLLVVLFVLPSLAYSTQQQERKPLYFSYITSLTGKGFTANSGIPAVELAVDWINNSSQLLQNYTLNFRGIFDSKVSMIIIDYNIGINNYL